MTFVPPQFCFARSLDRQHHVFHLDKTRQPSTIPVPEFCVGFEDGMTFQRADRKIAIVTASEHGSMDFCNVQRVVCHVQVECGMIDRHQVKHEIAKIAEAHHVKFSERPLEGSAEITAAGHFGTKMKHLARLIKIDARAKPEIEKWIFEIGHIAGHIKLGTRTKEE